MCIPIFAAIGTAMGASAASAAAVGTMTVMTAASTALSAKSAYDQSRMAQDVATRNAATAEAQAKDAQARGEKDAQEIARKAASFKSSQRAGLAGHGLDVGYGLAADLQDQTDFFSEGDIATARSNASKEAWARRAQSANFQAEATSQSPWMQATGSLLGGGAKVADMWYQYGKR